MRFPRLVAGRSYAVRIGREFPSGIAWACAGPEDPSAWRILRTWARFRLGKGGVPIAEDRVPLEALLMSGCDVLDWIRRRGKFSRARHGGRGTWNQIISIVLVDPMTRLVPSSGCGVRRSPPRAAA